LLPFTTPFVYAAAVYGLFHYLDERASGPATKAISAWLQPREYDKTAVADAMVEIFDRLYTRPLLGWRAFMRSALFTICMTVVFVYEFGLLSKGNRVENGLMTWTREVGHVWAWFILAQSVLAIVICDYVALFIIRPFLSLGRHRQVIASLLAPVAGISIVLGAFYGLGKWVEFEVVQWFIAEHLKSGVPENLTSENFFEDFIQKDLVAKVAMIGYMIGRLRWVLMPAAFVVHLWLPLFGLCVILLRGLNYFRRAVGGTQWFLEGGREHPLDAIGYIGAGLTFVATVVIQNIV
jgi:hypothetical protein